MPDAKGSAITTFNHLAAHKYVLCRQGFSSVVFQAVAGQLRHLQQRFTSHV